MASCERCRWQVQNLVRVASAAGAPMTARIMTARIMTARTLTAKTLTMTKTPRTSKNHALLPPRRTPSSWARQHQHTPARWFSGTADKRILGMGGSLAESYRVLGESERLYKACSRAADYHITDEARKKDEVERLEDGEELGRPVDKNNVWHKTFQLQPSFSTWSHVTMLHLYLLNARVRCFDREAYRSWQQQLVDHFFFECEKKMHLDHNITSSALRQRYLKDIFVQWRGLLLAYDEGLVKGDAVLASAVWRNLFKGAPDVDPRALLAIVGWLRASLVALEATSDMVFAERAEEILGKPVAVFWTRLEEPFKQGAAAAQSAATTASSPPVPAQKSSPNPAGAA